MLSNRIMPAQRPGLSKQDYATPPEFIAAVKAKFGVKDFQYDLAASAINTKSRFYFDEKVDSLKQNWHLLYGDLWLNPPFGHIEPWAAKCKASHTALIAADRRIFFLTPASIGANWFADHVWGVAAVYALQGRLSFDGIAPYPKDCMLSVYGEKPGFSVWKWGGRFT